MPKYTALPEYGAAVAVEAGDIVQNTGRHLILVCAAGPAHDDDALEVPPRKGLTITTAEQIFVRCASRHGGSFKIVRGL